ncbi:MAG: lamin tail domain-containing protein, partial [Bacteroidota bacterium]|nr:lamin tail domain-containing protein [Bacteroidota bacterium]
NDTAIQINFSEPMDATSSLDPMNYQISGGVGNPDALAFVAGGPDKIVMSINEAFSPNQEYTVLYQDLKDLAGNLIESGSFSFAIVIIDPEDIIINELMPDPSPTVGLPDNEYLEIFNRRNLPIELTGWKIQIGTTEKTFPLSTIPANSYLIVCDEDMYDEYAAFGNAVGLDFSTYFLSNDGTSVQLFDDEDNLITSVTYTDEWYQDPNKDDGGWSIERIDPNNTCSGMNNWAASESLDGGTPGAQNSIFGENIDTEAPEILSWELSSANEITLNFSEVPDTNTLFDYSNFYLTPDFGEPILITQNEEDPRAIRLQFIAGFLEDISYTLTIQNIADLCENVMPNTEITFINYIATHFDVLITEIMADPSPQVYLPDAEYVEFYNHAEYPVNLAGWKFSRGSTEIELPAIEIPVNGYVCLTNRDYVDDFSGIENVYGVTDLPSLTNAYGELQLVNPEGTLIHFVNYSENWYQSPTKQEGGWSLEMKDLNNPCAGGENWAESVSETGGTPGQENSVIANVSDEDAPEIMRAIVHAPDTLRVYFNEALHPEFQANPTKFNVNNSIGTPITAERMPNRLDALELIFSTEFEAHTVYVLTMTDSITDCVGNQIGGSINTIFALPDTVEPKDIIINEILFNPLAGGSDYVELYNRSEKFINLSDLRIATRDDSLIIDKVNSITETGFMIFPGDHVVISEDIAAVESAYYCENPQLLLEIEDLPSYTNTSGRAVLCTRNLQIIDEMYYHEDWHFQLLREVKGVALERIDYDQSAADENNWHSAAESVGFGTPTYKNSQYRPYGEYENAFELSPESISPDNDGYQDYLNIHYILENSGVVLSVTIYDAAGHLIRNVTENELLAAEGTIQWDGLDNNNQHPGAGIYIVLLDYYDLQGNRQQEKRTCVVAVMR